MSLIGRVASIPNDAFRIPLLCVVFPIEVISYTGISLMPVAWGGHPNKWRLLTWDYYRLPCALFWAAWDGAFVKEDCDERNSPPF